MSNDIVKKDRRRDFEAMDWVRDDLAGKVPPEEYGLLLWLAMKCDGNHTCFPGIETMAKVFGKNERTIRRWLDNLEVLGLLSKKRRRNRSTLYTLNVHSQPDTGVHSSEPDTDVHSGPDTGVHSEPDTHAHLSTTVPLSEEEASHEVVVPTTTTGEISEKTSGEVKEWTKLKPEQMKKLAAIKEQFAAEGLDPDLSVQLMLQEWPSIRKAILSGEGADYKVTEFPQPGYVLYHMPYVLKHLASPAKSSGYVV
jgi:hypothetical protein